MKYSSEFLKSIFLRQALDVMHRRGLYDEAFASQLVNMMSSLSFNSLEISNVKIRNQFIAKLQHDFESKYNFLEL